MTSPFGIVSDEIDRDPVRAIEIGTALGIRRYELRMFPSGRVPDVAAREIDAVVAACALHDAAVTAISPGIYKYARNAADARLELERRFLPSAALAKRLGLDQLIVFGPAKPRANDDDGPMHSSDDPPDWVSEALDALADAAARCGVTVAIEPEPLSYTDTAKGTAALLARVDRPELRVNYDPGNIAWAQGDDPREAVHLLARWIANVHVKNLRDLPRDRFPTWSPADEGVIDYAHQFAELRRIGYHGPISLEPHIDGRIETIERCARAVERCLETSEKAASAIVPEPPGQWLENALRPPT